MSTRPGYWVTILIFSSDQILESLFTPYPGTAPVEVKVLWLRTTGLAHCFYLNISHFHFGGSDSACGVARAPSLRQHESPLACRIGFLKCRLEVRLHGAAKWNSIVIKFLGFHRIDLQWKFMVLFPGCREGRQGYIFQKFRCIDILFLNTHTHVLSRERCMPEVRHPDY